MVTWPRRADFSVSFDSALKWLNSVQEINFGPLHLFSLIFSRILTDSISGSFHLVAASLVLTYTHTHTNTLPLSCLTHSISTYMSGVFLLYFSISLCGLIIITISSQLRQSIRVDPFPHLFFFFPLILHLLRNRLPSSYSSRLFIILLNVPTPPPLPTQVTYNCRSRNEKNKTKNCVVT